jgi:hypothetical protein
MAKKPKRPRDTNQLAKFITDLATGDKTEKLEDSGKDPAAVRRGQLGGAIGGKARAAVLSKKKRKSIAKKAAKARWSA